MNRRGSTADRALLETVERYYADKLRTFGSSPRGVDWNSAASQTLRFERLLQIFEEQARSIVTANDSPDLPFRYSVNPYRG